MTTETPTPTAPDPGLTPDQAVEKMQDQRAGIHQEDAEYRKPDDDGPQENFKSEREALDELQKQESERAEGKAAAERELSAYREETAQSEEATEQLAHHAANELPRLASDYQRDYRDFATRVAELDKYPPAARKALEQSLQVEADQLGQRANSLRYVEATAGVVINQRRIQKMYPELKDKAVLQELVSWGAKKYGLSEQEVRSIRDPNQIMPAIREWKAERQQRVAEQRAGPKPTFGGDEASVYAGARVGAGAARDMREARANLERSGSIHDALELLTQERLSR